MNNKNLSAIANTLQTTCNAVDLVALATVTGGAWPGHNSSKPDEFAGTGGPLTAGSGPITDDRQGAYYCALGIGRGAITKDPFCNGQ